MKLFSPIQSPSQLSFLSSAVCVCVCVRERERDNGSCVSCSPTYLLFSVFLILRFLKSGSGLHLFLAHMNVNIALQFFLMSFKLKKKQSHIDDILEGKRDREMALWTPGSSTQPGTTGRQLKKKKTSEALLPSSAWLAGCRRADSSCILAAIEVRGGSEQLDPHWHHQL